MHLLHWSFSFFVFCLLVLGMSAVAQPKQKAPGSYAKINGLELYYETHGKGRPLVLLHGGLGSTSMFGDNLKALAQHYKVIAVDLQGHGRTADIDRPLSVELMADDVAALIQHLKLGRADVFGYSLGGGVALQVGLRHPELVNKLVIVSAAFRSNAYYPEILAQQGQINEEAAEMMKQTPMYQGYVAIAPRPQDFPKLLKKIGEAMKQNFDFSKQIASLQAPTLVMAADADMFPPSHAVEFFGLLGGGQRDGGWDGSGRPKSRLSILPGLTHYNIFASPLMVSVALPFLQEGT
ncbi:alpha/beta fold hydrolase [Stigmatella erecta]|uniref:Pimeloyl-ACP methyl ester carboxylesterase n=1 Tax=Stigmatella erecta TaxID=83460 RepID=A0A1I0FKN4_9BACT|nr:alpha/beta hydrolase [Stigmatella erecta]SET58125.1 Pimeloyl-ACP methyl ester carboxylesterase [Stigmatella erecta]